MELKNSHRPNYIICNLFLLNKYRYGPPAVVGVLGVYFGSLFLWYKTSAFMSKKFYRHVLLGER